MKRVKLWLLCGWLVLVAAMFCGCNGIWADARHAALLDTTAAVAQSASDRAANADACDTCVGDWTRDEVREFFKTNAELWKYFQQAKDGQGTFPGEVNP